MPLTWHSLFETTDGLAAVGTLGLALGTLSLALLTRSTARETRTLAQETKHLAELTEQEVRAVTEQADAARQEVQVSRQALQATIRPQMIDCAPNSVRVDRLGITTFHIFSRNVGSGLAFIRKVTMQWAEPRQPGGRIFYAGLPDRAVVPPGEQVVASFQFPASDAPRLKALEELSTFAVEILYTDAAQGALIVTTFDIVFLGESQGWAVNRLHFSEADDPSPYVSSGTVKL